MSSAASAGLVISFQDTVIQQGATGTMNVYIHSDTGTDPLLYAFGLGIRITPNQPTALEFQATQNHSELSSTDYVFFPSGSANLNDPGSASGTVGPATDYVVLDTSNLSGVSVPMAPFVTLLSVLDLTTLTGTPANPGDTYTVDVFRASGNITDESFFVDSIFDDIDFRVEAGTVTVSDEAAVPEPSTLVIASCAIGIFAAFRLRRQA